MRVNRLLQKQKVEQALYNLRHFTINNKSSLMLSYVEVLRKEIDVGTARANRIAELKDALNKVAKWLASHPMRSAEAMASSFEEMQDICLEALKSPTQKALEKATPMGVKMRDKLTKGE